MKIISRFKGSYRFLSNFADSPIEYEGYHYKNVETAYQERKTTDPKRREYIRASKTASESARRGRSSKTIIRDGWFEGMKGELMRELVFAKFEQNPELMDQLLDTGDAILIEGNYWHDNYFGICNCKECFGKKEQRNILGEILMEIREKNRIPDWIKEV